jgi:hypothetical protein
MRIFRSVAIAVAGIALAGSAMSVAQSSSVSGKPGRVYGYVDLKTGAFHPGTHAAATPGPSTSPVFKTYSGHIEVTISTTLAGTTYSSLPKGYVILCNVDLEGYVFGFGYTELGASQATVVGNVATCSVNIPVSWTGLAGGAATDYFFSGEYRVTASYPPGGGTQPNDYIVFRETDGSLYSTTTGITEYPLPSGGATTTIPIDAVI